jgi:hypothetical protein
LSRCWGNRSVTERKGRTGDIAAGADTEVRHPAADALADRFQQAEAVEAVEQAEGVAAADKDRLGRTHRRRRIGVAVDTVEFVAGVDTAFDHGADVAVVVGERVRHE